MVVQTGVFCLYSKCLQCVHTQEEVQAAFVEVIATGVQVI